MAQAASTICPACRARNKAAWDYCARCGESLAGAAPEVPKRAAAASTARRSPSALPLVVLFGCIVGGTVLAAWWYLRTSSPQAESRPEPGVFGALGANQALPPSAGPPVVSAEGEAAGLLADGDASGAVSALRSAIASDPTNADLHAALGEALRKAGDPAGALAAFGEAARLAPDRHKLTFARNLVTSGRRDEAERLYQDLLQGGEAGALVKEDYGRFLYAKGDYAKAAALLEEAVRTRGDDLVVRQELGVALELSGSKAKAMEVYKELLSADPLANVARERLAGLMVGAGQGKAAEELMREGVAAAPASPVLRRGLGGVLEQAGRSADAAREYAKYLELSPNAEDAAEIRARVARLTAGKATT